MSSAQCPSTERQVDILVERDATLRGPRNWGCRLGDVMGSFNFQLVSVVKDLMQEREGGGRCQRMHRMGKWGGRLTRSAEVESFSTSAT